MFILAVFSCFLLPRDARHSSSQSGGMFRSMDAYVLLIGLIAFGSMVSEGPCSIGAAYILKVWFSQARAWCKRDM